MGNNTGKLISVDVWGWEKKIKKYTKEYRQCIEKKKKKETTGSSFELECIGGMEKLKWQRNTWYNMVKMSFTWLYQTELYDAQKDNISVRKMTCSSELSKGLEVYVVTDASSVRWKKLGVKEQVDELSHSQKK